MWHASAMARDREGPVPWDRCGLGTRQAMRAAVLGLLAGVGVGDAVRGRSAIILHARRRLSDVELAALTPAWCAIPAVDAGGDLAPW